MQSKESLHREENLEPPGASISATELGVKKDRKGNKASSANVLCVLAYFVTRRWMVKQDVHVDGSIEGGLAGIRRMSAQPNHRQKVGKARELGARRRSSSVQGGDLHLLLVKNTLRCCHAKLNTRIVQAPRPNLVAQPLMRYSI